MKGDINGQSHCPGMPIYIQQPTTRGTQELAGIFPVKLLMIIPAAHKWRRQTGLTQPSNAS